MPCGTWHMAPLITTKLFRLKFLRSCWLSANWPRRQRRSATPMTTTALSPWEDRKIQGQHRDRCAVVYVRQSTLQQMVRHHESSRLQYSIVERALSFGWARAQVLII